MAKPTCRAVGCPETRSPGQFMCRTHWLSLPFPLRRQVTSCWRAWVNRTNENGSQLWLDYIEACDEAKRLVADREGKLDGFVADLPRLKTLHDMRALQMQRPAHVNRAMWRQALVVEREAYRTGRWPPWDEAGVEEIAMAKRLACRTRGGWASDVTRVVRNGLYCVLFRPVERPGADAILHLAIRTASNLEPPWRDLQRIKNELVGEARFAVQVCPPADQLIDEADMYHLWVMPEGYVATFGLHL